MAHERRFAGLLVFVFLLLAVLVDGSFLDNFKNLWGKSSSSSDASSGRAFSNRGGYYDSGQDYMMSGASQRGWGWGGGGGWGDDHQNLDLYSLLGGLSFASLLGATIIYLARRNTSGRRRRSADGLSYLEDDEVDFSEDPSTKGLNIIEMIDTFLDNRHMLYDTNTSSEESRRPSKSVYLGPGVVPHSLAS